MGYRPPLHSVKNPDRFSVTYQVSLLNPSPLNGPLNVFSVLEFFGTGVAVVNRVAHPMPALS
jgi:hypothetical protein